LIQTRQLLGYYDATELSLLTGKSNRPVTILVFTDKIMIVKRKNSNLKGRDYLENIEEQVKSTMSSSMLQKAKEAYNGLPLEFKGWADIRAVELFQGLKGIVYYHFVFSHYTK
jgi:ribosomal 30S subunit maturation factor RimM